MKRASALSSALVVLTSLFVLLPSLVFITNRVQSPGDGTRVVLDFARTDPGLVVRPLVPTSELREGDVVLAIDGTSVDILLEEALTGNSPGRSTADNQSVRYTIRRADTVLSVTVVHSTYPFGAALLDQWGVFLFLGYLLATGVFVFIRRPYLTGARLFLLVSSIAFANGTVFNLGLQTSDLLIGWKVALWLFESVVMDLAILAVLLHLSLVFPHRQPPVRRRPWLILLGYLGTAVVLGAFVVARAPAAPTYLGRVFLPLQATAAVSLVYFLLVLASWTNSFRTSSDSAQRRQVAWIIWGMAVAFIPFIALSLVPTITSTGVPLGANFTIVGLFLCAIPTTCMIAILRERLFDIGFLVDRTLVYVPLTIALTIGFLGTVILLQRLLHAVVGETAGPVVVLSALLTAALFQPARRLTRDAVERLLHPERRAARLLIAGFGRAVRDEVDPRVVIGNLLGVVDVTMAPTTATVWLRQGKPKSRLRKWTILRATMSTEAGASNGEGARGSVPSLDPTPRVIHPRLPREHNHDRPRQPERALGMRVVVGVLVGVFAIALGLTWRANATVGEAGILRGARWRDSPDHITVMSIAIGSAADKAGIQSGDAIVRVNGQPVTDESMAAWASRRPGDVAKLRVDHQASGGSPAKPPVEDVTLTLGSRMDLPMFGLSLVVYTIGGSLAMGVAALAALARPRDVAARLLLFGCFCYAMTLLTDLWAYLTYSLWIERAFFYVFALGTSALIQLFLTFPVKDRMLTRLQAVGPRFLRPVGGATVLIYVIPLLVLALLVQRPSIESYTAMMFILAMLVRILIALIKAYRNARTELARAQLRWVLLGLGLGVLGTAIGPESGFRFLDPQKWTAVVTVGMWVFFPFSVGIAILRYRLWDIDVLINRSLVYTILSATLVGLYVGGSALVGWLLQSMSGQSSDIALVLPTFVLAILFDPLRNRVQEFIDLRFYRRNYDALQTLESFGASVRDEVDPTRLAKKLALVVDQTMRPSAASLWLRWSNRQFRMDRARFNRRIE